MASEKVCPVSFGGFIPAELVLWLLVGAVAQLCITSMVAMADGELLFPLEHRLFQLIS